MDHRSSRRCDYQHSRNRHGGRKFTRVESCFTGYELYINLRDGSINHLAAFERGVSRNGTGNRFNGNGQPARGQATDQASGRAGRGFRSDRGNRTSGGFGQQGTLENCILT